jgi:glyoxylase-like metal-dependent hydrolase (beta-lactamase superfamily II)
VELRPGIHLVASGSGGFDLTDPFDCHAYLVERGGAGVLIDAGIGAAVDDLLQNLEAAGVDPDEVRLLLLTHAHPDHAGAAAAIRERLPSVEVAASPEVARWVASADEEAISLANGKLAGFYPEDFGFEPCPVERELRHGDVVRSGELAFEAIATPGHSAGHLSYRLETETGTSLFCGDLLFWGGRISLVSNWDCSLEDYVKSLVRLRGGEVDSLLPGHHSISLARGQRHIDTALRLIDRGFVPPSIV